MAVGKPHRRSFFDLFFLSRRLALELGGQKSDKQQCRTNHARSHRFEATPGLCLAKGALAGTLFPYQGRRYQAVAHGRYVFGNSRDVARAHARIRKKHRSALRLQPRELPPLALPQLLAESRRRSSIFMSRTPRRHFGSIRRSREKTALPGFTATRPCAAP